MTFESQNKSHFNPYNVLSPVKARPNSESHQILRRIWCVKLTIVWYHNDVSFENYSENSAYQTFKSLNIFRFWLIFTISISLQNNFCCHEIFWIFMCIVCVCVCLCGGLHMRSSAFVPYIILTKRSTKQIYTQTWRNSPYICSLLSAKWGIAGLTSKLA